MCVCVCVCVCENICPAADLFENLTSAALLATILNNTGIVNITLSRVRVNIVAVEKQQLLYIVSGCQ
jgi:hypothetical protein